MEDTVQSYDNSWENACQAIDGADTANSQHREQVLAESGEDVEVIVVDVWRASNQRVVVDGTVRQLAADDVWMLGQLFECRGRNEKSIRDAWIMVACFRSAFCTRTGR